jgi:ribosomal RNA-processing protein 8
MFAIPGWSVSANSLKTQKLSSNDAAGISTIEDDDSHTATNPKPSKKRKRGKTTAKKVNVTPENFENLWKKHIEHKGSPANVDDSAPVRKRQAKKPKRGKDVEASVTHVAGLEKNSDEVEAAQKRKVEKPSGHTVLPGAQSQQKLAEKAPSRDATRPSSTVFSTTAKGTLSQLATSPAKTVDNSSTSKLTPLQTRMREKLISSRFRYLNETLYTTPSTASYELFKQNPSFFSEYHEGFQRQIGVWPENPADGFVKWIRQRGAIGLPVTKLKSQKAQFRKKLRGKKGTGDEKPEHQMEPVELRGLDPLPRHVRSGLCTIADLGCGNAQIARDLSNSGDSTEKGPIWVKSLNLRIHSFDLAAPYPLITVADIRALPLADSSIDIAVFCLALMGTNWIEFIEEAWRVLRWKGECWVSEVSSRFGSSKTKRVDHSVGKRIRSMPKGKKAEEEKLGYDEEAEMGEEGLAEEESAGNPSTDVSAFVAVLRTRGFEVVGKPEMGNKMFVRMRFSKGLVPTRGKHVPQGGQISRGPRFVDRNRDVDDKVLAEDEAKALKPCVYKTR